MGHDAKHELFRGTRPRVLTNNPEDPFGGRIFVWAWTQWFEREEGASGAVTFTPVADSEKELRGWLAQQGPYDLTEMEGDACLMVRDEFLDQVPLYPEAPELTVEKPFREQDVNEDIEHY